MSSIIACAVDHLKELECSMRNEDVKFKEDDIENIDRIADYLQQLEFEVKRLHDELETETINASVLRHTLTFFPRQIKSEIDEAVKAARESNMAVILDFKEQLDKITKNLEKLNARDVELTRMIATLQPEKEATQKRHENIISSLNQRMSEKAECQIKLNETRDTLRETNHATADLDEDILGLKEQLIKERGLARDEKIKLEEEKAETNEKAATQEKRNNEKKKEVDLLVEKLKVSEDKLRMLFRENERLEISINELKKKIDIGEKGLKEEKDQFDFFMRESLRLTTLDAETQQNYAKDKENILNRTKQASEETVLQSDVLKDLKMKQELTQEALKEVYKSYKSLQDEVLFISKSVDKVKDEIGSKLKDMLFVDAKNKTLYEEMSVMEESHNGVMEELQREMEEFKAQLLFERDNRMRKQQERETKLAEIDNFQSETQLDQADAARYLAGKRAIFSELTDRNEEIEQDLMKKDQISLTLTLELNDVTSKLENMKNKLGVYTNNLENDIAKLSTTTERITNEITETTPAYQDLIKLFDERCKDYDDTKRTVILSKSRKSHLEESITKSRDKIGEHETSREILRMQVKQKREEALEKMKKQNEEIKILENDILNTGMRYTTITGENNKFKQAISEYEIEIATYDTKTSENYKNVDDMQSEYSKLQNEIEEGWKADHVIESVFEEQDIALVKKLSTILAFTDARETKLSNITELIYRQLNDLSQSLEIMVGQKQITDNEQNAASIVPFDSLTERSTTFDTLSIQPNKSPRKSARKHRPESIDAVSTVARVGTRN